MMLRFSLLLVLLCGLLSLPAVAQDEELEALLALDLEELATVSVASKRDESIYQAPAVVSLISRQEIDRYGGLNLLDLFNRAPALQVFNSTFAPNNSLSIRAATNQHYTNRILFLLNGRPFRNTNSGGWLSPLLTQYPLANIDHLEIIRGPGSVLYGSNAFSGVINIVTRQPEDDSAELGLAYGSFDYQNLSGRGTWQEEDWSVVIAGNLSDTEGDEFSLVDEAAVEDSYFTEEQGHGVALHGHYLGFSLDAYEGYVEQETLGVNPAFPPLSLKVLRRFADLGYGFSLTEDWSAQLNLTYNYTDVVVVQVPDGAKEDLLIAEANIQGQLFTGFHLLLGSSYDYRDGVAPGAKYDGQGDSTYLQVDWQAYDSLKLVAGLQYNHVEGIDADLSPRAGMILTPGDHWGAKLLYGEAFRTPAALENRIYLPGVLVGLEDTRPEIIKTTELQVFYKAQQISAALTLYHSRLDDVIGRTLNQEFGGRSVTNLDEQSFQGIEFEYQQSLSERWSIQGSATYQTGESETGIDEPTFFPNFNAKLGVAYIRRAWSIGVFDSYFGDASAVSNANPNVNEVNPEPLAYHLLSANLTLDLTQILRLGDTAPEVRLKLYGENLLDEEVYFPEFNRQLINSYPIETGRGVFAQLSVGF